MTRKGKGPSFNLKNIDFKLLLKNRNVLYVVLFLSVANLFHYLMAKQLDAVAFFIIIGFLATYFSKNMIVVMLTAIISTFLLVQINLLGRVQEGMEDNVDASGNAIAAEKTPEKTPEKTTLTTPPVTGTTAAATAAALAPDATISSKMRADITKGPGTPKTESFQQQLNPARFNASDDDTDIDARYKPKIDYASTLESAYDNLDKLLSSDAIRNMSSDTERLAEKQQLLMGNIEKMTPIMEKASGILGKMDIGGMMGSLQDKLKGFEGMKPKSMA
jgi:hypothetical protein